MKCVVAAVALAVASAQDPAQGWLGYATASCPAGTRLTFLDAYWKNGAKPKDSGSFYSPWFGSDTSDNLNLIQPVNPWLGNQWVIYNEYFQWQPEYNFNSAQHNVEAGDLLYGSLTYNKNNSMTIYHNVSGSTSWEVASDIKIQKAGNDFKNYSIAYFVYEKVAPCSDFPPDGVVTFTNIRMFCDGKQVLSPKWTTAYVEDVCNNRATIIDPATIKITWDTKAADPSPELIAKSQANKALGFERKHTA